MTPTHVPRFVYQKLARIPLQGLTCGLLNPISSQSRVSSGYFNLLVSINMENERFNKLEQSIIDWLIENNKDKALIDQLKVVQCIERKYTKLGFFISLSVPKELKQINTNSNYVVGTNIESIDIEFGGGSLLFIKDGYIDCLELYANGSFFGEDVQNFKLSITPKA